MQTVANPDKQIKVIQAFDSYLDTTTNWIYSLLDAVPDVQMVIAAERFVPCNFYSSKFKYVEFPIRSSEHNKDQLGTRLWNKLVPFALRYYPRMVADSVRDASLIHSHFSFVGWNFRKVAKLLDIPHVISFYGFDYEYLPRCFPEWRKRYAVLLDSASMLLCEGNHGAAILERMGCPAEKIQVARLGVSAENIPFFNRHKEPGCLNLLQVASFSEKKGHIYTVMAFIEALKSCPNMTLTLVGREHSREGGNVTQQVKSLVSGTPAEERVRFLTHIDFSRLHEFFAAYDVFIHPSCYTRLKDCEGGAPIVLLDAQATGMPIISTVHCDIPDEVVDGVTGLLSPEKDVNGIANSIRRFYEMDQAEYDRYAHAAREHVRKEFDPRDCGLKLREIYARLL